jgi:ubiquinone/menaquinone biosynthesis C-methylase UbiE
VATDTTDQWPRTAYRGAVARDYDDNRFTTPQGRLFSELEARQLRRAAERLAPDARVLEVGCGTARFARDLARQGFVVVATDPSHDMIDLAARKCAGLERISFRQAEGADLGSSDDTFDLVFAIRVVNQTESKNYALRMIAEMVRVAAHGGLILIEFVNQARPFAKRSTNVRLSFTEIAHTARDAGCDVVHRDGVLVFSQSVLNRVPDALVPLWGRLERLAATVFWRWASRGYILLRKN